MFYAEWETGSNGVVLKLEQTPNTLSVSPRPVFWEELNILGCKSYFSYPESTAPLCWACGRKYYIHGRCFMEVNGGNMYDAPEVIVKPDEIGIQLVPIDLDKIFNLNEDLLFYLEFEALEFLASSFTKYAETASTQNQHGVDWERLRKIQEQIEQTPMAVVQQSCGSFDIIPMDEAHSEEKQVISGSKVEEIIVSFSGGKDSQVVLDLATRALSPSYFSVVYSDTGYELPSSLELYSETQNHYHQRYPSLKFDLTKNHQDIMYYWEQMGAPSRMHRWCCSVMKTAPLYRYLKNRAGREKQPKVLVFEGVRAEESTRRSEYLRIGSSVKHRGVINARPIFNWNNTEVYLYILRRKLPFNRAYREGLSRVGCVLCPYSTGWSEHIVMRRYPSAMAPFVNHLEARCKEIGVSDISTYIKEGRWKMRGGSRTLLNQKSSIEVLVKSDDLVLLITNPREDFFEWLKVLGTYTTRTEGATVSGEVYRRFGKQEVCQPYILEQPSQGKYKVTFEGISQKPEFQSQILKVLNKITYCVHCEACEVECPTGALQVTPTVSIDSTKCIHCLRCVDFKDKGCMMAKSLAENIFNTSTQKKMNLDRYNTFGLQQEWLLAFMSQMNDFFSSEHGLNKTKQVPPLKTWLREALLLNPHDTTPARLAQLMVERRVFPAQQKLIWELIWCNLSVNSAVCRTFINIVPTNTSLSKKDLIAKVGETTEARSERTTKNAVDALINLIVKSHLKNLGMFALEMKGRTVTSIERHTYTPSAIAIAYAIYSFAQRHDTHFVSVTELLSQTHEDSLYKQFGLTSADLEPALRMMQNKFGIADVQLSMGLDNVILNKDLSPVDALNIALEKS